jgi:hypothetical protein
MNTSQIVEMKNNQFPFGELSDENIESKKIYIKKKYVYRNQAEYKKLKEKIEKLKGISHKNTINLRSTDDQGNGQI